jgi:hypothetical protein
MLIHGGETKRFAQRMTVDSNDGEFFWDADSEFPSGCHHPKQHGARYRITLFLDYCPLHNAISRDTVALDGVGNNVSVHNGAECGGFRLSHV